MVTLADGKVVKPNLRLMTITEYRGIFGPDRTQEYEDELVARCYGMTVEELTHLDYVDYHAVCSDFLHAAQHPLDDPN